MRVGAIRSVLRLGEAAFLMFAALGKVGKSTNHSKFIGPVQNVLKVQEASFLIIGKAPVVLLNFEWLVKHMFKVYLEKHRTSWLLLAREALLVKEKHYWQE